MQVLDAPPRVEHTVALRQPQPTRTEAPVAGYSPVVVQGEPDVDAGIDAEERRIGEALIAGDERALRSMYDRWGAMVHSYCVRSIGDRETAADATQETFIAAWKSRERFDPERGALPAWLVGMRASRGARWPREPPAASPW